MCCLTITRMCGVYDVGSVSKKVNINIPGLCAAQEGNGDLLE